MTSTGRSVGAPARASHCWRQAGYQVTLPLTPASVSNYVVPRAKKPNHFLMQAWSFAVLARKLSLQALRQKRRPQWWWQTRPNFLPQFAQRFSNLVTRLSDSEVGAPFCHGGRAVRRRISSRQLDK